MFRSAIACVLGFLCVSAMAQMSPVGLWQTISDTDGKATSEVRITETPGGLVGVVEKALTQNSEPNCDKCTDERKGKSKLGMEIIRAAKKTEGKDVWEGGNILDPNNGTVYKLKMTPTENGKKLEVRGFVGFALLGRTQTWIRVP
jgi:uncharacterized protein (DUF2147 family)